MSERVLPEGWVETTLGQLVEYGKAEKVTPEQVSGNTWVLELEDIEKSTSRIIQRLDFSERKFKSTKNRFKKGEVLYGKLRPYLDKVVIAERDGVCTTEIVPLDGRPHIDNRYLFYWLKSSEFLAYVNAVGYGVNMPRLGTKDGKAAPFVLAPYDEQVVIADKLDDLLAQINNMKARLDAILAILKKIRQSMLGAAVSGKLAEHGIEKKEVLGQTIKFEEILKNKKNLSYGVLKPGDYDQNGTPMVRVMDIREWGGIDEAGLFKISSDLSQNFKRTIVDEGDVVLSVMATIGRAAVVPARLAGANVNRALAVIKLSDAVTSEYVLLQLLSPYFQENFIKNQIGSAQKRINLSDLRRFDIWVPSIEVQNEIVRRVEQLFAFANQVEQQVKSAQTRINKLTQSILAKAFRGELTAKWRADNPELVSGNSSAASLLERIKKGREDLSEQSKNRKASKSKKADKTMSKKSIKVVDALKGAKKPLSGQELLAAAGYPSDADTEQLEQFFLDIRESLSAQKIVKIRRDEKGQDWFSLT
ncbi:hypothetical protein BZY95_16790 [Billgrantia desiderata SP1]|uniref:restriction endonuclease subunit S n=1 Tax=Billgrantia desiderata TaxID=52021 RepID=UPI000A38FC73|nr:restriction endonuclease subunit S [Halomonas desiderata]OUE39423.1 hypothetical protein BZY95_16790 [Halomonas desiderata SP1]